MKVTPTALPEVLVVEPLVHADARGDFREAWRESRYAAAGISGPFVQDNVARSRCGVVRGLHFQHPEGQGKLVSAVHGRIFDVAVDIRRGSPTFGRWVAAELGADDGRQLWIPPGFAHGYQALTDGAVVAYKVTAYWRGEYDRVVRWDDPAFDVRWPLPATLVSEKDLAAPLVGSLPADALPSYDR